MGVGCWIIMGWSSVAKRGAVAFLLKSFFFGRFSPVCHSRKKKSTVRFSFARNLGKSYLSLSRDWRFGQILVYFILFFCFPWFFIHSQYSPNRMADNLLDAGPPTAKRPKLNSPLSGSDGPGKDRKYLHRIFKNCTILSFPAKKEKQNTKK